MDGLENASSLSGLYGLKLARYEKSMPVLTLVGVSGEGGRRGGRWRRFKAVPAILDRLPRDEADGKYPDRRRERPNSRRRAGENPDAAEILSSIPLRGIGGGGAGGNGAEIAIRIQTEISRAGSRKPRAENR